ncbi:MAG: PDZ domain-containing protein [Ginsengibacter sp.]
MKKIILPGVLTICIAFGSAIVFAQKEKSPKKESREIIIRSDKDVDTKMKIEIDGEKVTVNGKPLSDYKDDDVTIIERDVNRKFGLGGGDNMIFTPRGPNEDFEFFNDDLENSGPRTFMGVVTDKTPDGVKVTEVMKGSGAEKAGLQKGDVITKIDDKDISNPDDLLKVVRSYKPDKEVKVYYKRNDRKSDVKVKLGEKKESNRTFIFNDDNGFKKGNGSNFKMPVMPRMPNLPNTYFKHWSNSNIKLGVKVEDLPEDAGAKIISVEEGSAADKAGLKKDDIITEMNGEKISNVEEVRSQLMGAEDKDSFNLKAKRNNSEMNFEIKISKAVNSADL